MYHVVCVWQKNNICQCADPGARGGTADPGARGGTQLKVQCLKWYWTIESLGTTPLWYMHSMVTIHLHAHIYIVCIQICFHKPYTVIALTAFDGKMCKS